MRRWGDRIIAEFRAERGDNVEYVAVGKRGELRGLNAALSDLYWRRMR